MTTFYERDSVRITERSLSFARCRYSLGQLDNFRRARGPADRLARRAAGSAALSMPVVIVSGWFVPAGGVLVLAGILVAVPAALAAARAWWRPAEYQLWADYQGSPVQLYRTRDAIEFGRITRAVIRVCAGRSTTA
ncbi:DUF6232 family protein [Actinoplanes sp. NPDC051346]|uniref:DUF6232 family protein n=1 Tax=Actinoplanes sp. NPDC051346 TaxID=3155048 RepID=UPI00343B021A